MEVGKMGDSSQGEKQSYEIQGFIARPKGMPLAKI